MRATIVRANVIGPLIHPFFPFAAFFHFFHEVENDLFFFFSFRTNMSNKRHKTSTTALLEIIPSNACTPEQVARWDDGTEWPTYRFLRVPMNLQELDTHKRIAIWRDNGTLTYLLPRIDCELPSNDANLLSIACFGTNTRLFIVGKTNEAVTETAAFFIELKEPMDWELLHEYEARALQDTECSLHINTNGRAFDFSTAPPHCLTRIFDVYPYPSREVGLCNLTIVQRSLLL